MNLCEAVFDFSEYGIKPYLKEIRNSDGWRFFTCDIEDQEENTYQIRFSFDGYSRFIVSVDKELRINRYKTVSVFSFYLIDDYMKLHYKSGSNFLKSSYDEGDRIDMDGFIVPSAELEVL